MKEKKYYLGLDIGSASVGWAATNENYDLLRVRGKKTIGVRLFPEASSASERRINRSNRRRLERRKKRINLLQELLAPEISKVDDTFYLRLKESKFLLEDKTLATKSILFNDINYTDKEFHKKYPTIYHLRADLLEKENPDIREIYLACHHILKYRGNFLFEGENFSSAGTITEILRELIHEENFEGDSLLLLEDDNVINNIETILLDANTTRSDKSKKIKNIVNKNKQLDEFFKLSLGLTSSLDKLFNNEDYKEEEINKVIFSDGKYEEKRTLYEALLKDEITLLDSAKRVYDSCILAKVKKDGLTISQSKILEYNKHKEDKALLKQLITNDSKLAYSAKKELYSLVFKDHLKDNYVAYSGRNTLSKGGNGSITKKSSYEDFKKFLTKNVLNKLEKSPELDKILAELELEQFLPLQKTSYNGVIPYQIHLEELTKILKNAEKYYPSLKEKSEGYSVSEKIVKLLEFRIPYYIGPLNNYHEGKGGNAWIVKNSNSKITPWNFDKVVDAEASAEKFIRKMTNKCTYLLGEDVIPKNSLLYSEFEVLNAINNIKINDVKIPINIKNEIVEVFFKQKVQKVTKKKIENYLISLGLMSKNDVLSGIADNIPATLKSYVDMKNILQDKFESRMVEKIILWITLFGDTKKILKNKISKEFGHIISENQLNEIVKLRYRDWGRFSEKLLTGIHSEKFIDKSTGEMFNIINSMRNTNYNFMELLSDTIGYQEAIDKYNGNQKLDIKKLEYSLLDDVYVSPSVKRAVWQSLKIVDELVREIGEKPERIFVETTRSNKAEKKITSSRKKQLQELYKNIKIEEFREDSSLEQKNIKKRLEQFTDNDLRRKKLYLYYTQLGKCIYSGENIDIDDLFTDNYDIDHIFPRSLTKDDSITKNLVLVKAEYNRIKTDKYPLSYAFDKTKLEKARKLWDILKKKGLITEEKYSRLVRNEELTSDELSKFIARQLVETSQSTKAVASLLRNLYPNTEICYVKAENVSDFRRDFAYEKHEKNKKPNYSKVVHPELLKIRELNDHHHAHDAYLNIVVGNAFRTKFTANPYNFVKNDGTKYNLARIFDRDIKRGNVVAWEVEKTINTVLEVINFKRVLVTKKQLEQKGALYDATMYNKLTAKQESYFGAKLNDPSKDVTKYGGFTSIKIAYYTIVSYDLVNTKEKKKCFRIVPVPVYLSKTINNSDNIKELLLNNIKLKNNEYIENIKVIYKKLCIGNLIKSNKYLYYLGGKTSEYVSIDGAIQIDIDIKYRMLLREISKYNLLRMENKDIKVNNQKIDMISNFEIFNYLIEKMDTGIFKYKRNNKYGDFTIETKELYKKLSVEDQSLQILEVLNLLTNKKTVTNLKPLNLTTTRSKINMNLEDQFEFKIIEQSITGLREKVITIIDKE